MRETTTPHNYKPVDDFIVRITENKTNRAIDMEVLLDKEIFYNWNHQKQDDETKNQFNSGNRV